MHQNTFLKSSNSDDEPSNIFIKCWGSNCFETKKEVINYLKTQAPNPIFLRKRSKDEGTCVEIDVINDPQITFIFSPFSGDTQSDIMAIIFWLQKNEIAAKLISE